MRAIVQNTYGTPDALQQAELPTPTPGPGEVRIRVLATAVTRGDERIRTGDFPGITFVPGRLAMGIRGPRERVTGTMFSGVIDEVGDGVTRYQVGDDVFGSALSGAYATHMVLAEDGPLAPKPQGLSHVEAAALPYGGVTSYVFLRELADVQPGQSVCILGASGGVGHIAVQLAAHFGAHVTAVASAPTHAWLEELGADRVVDYRTDDYRAHGPYDLVFDTMGASGFGAARKALRAGGRYLSTMVTTPLIFAMALTATLGGLLFGGRKAALGVAMGSPENVEGLRQAVDAGGVRPVVDRVFSFENITDAHAYLASSAPRGVVVIEMPPAIVRPLAAAA